MGKYRCCNQECLNGDNTAVLTTQDTTPTLWGLCGSLDLQMQQPGKLFATCIVNGWEFHKCQKNTAIGPGTDLLQVLGATAAACTGSEPQVAAAAGIPDMRSAAPEARGGAIACLDAQQLEADVQVQGIGLAHVDFSDA